MNVLGELLRETPPTPASAETHQSAARVEKLQPERLAKFSVRDDQIHSLVQRLFFRRDPGLVRHVGFTPAETSAQTARLCFDVAKALVDEGTYEVGLIDADVRALSLPAQLQIPVPTDAQAPWAIAPGVWLVPRESWCRHTCRQPATDQNLRRLHDLVSEFDFSIVHCPPVSWLTARIGQSCDGLVLVLTANRTRRLVAAQIKDRLSAASIPLLGTVLAERRFPVPNGLYRSL